MHTVKSKYKNPDKYIATLKQHEAEAWSAFRCEKGRFVAPLRGNMTFTIGNYAFGTLKPEEEVKCYADVVSVHMEGGTSQVTVRFKQMKAENKNPQ